MFLIAVVAVATRPIDRGADLLYLEIQQKVRKRFAQVVQETFNLKLEEPRIDFPPRLEMGDLSIAACFELAKQLRQPPRKIAEQLAARILPIEGVERAGVAGAGYLNFFLDRAALASALFQLRVSPSSAKFASHGKILVEHTSINPNKAAHIGHLRNAVLGDTFARLMKFQGHRVEVQNYIDNTGVQVADVVVGFAHLEGKSLDDVKKLIADPSVRFDYYCWDLYARVFQHYDADPSSLALRSQALKAIEEGHGEMAVMADLISEAIVRSHLETMQRIGIRYDLLVQESEILRLDFWKAAFELLKKTGAIRYEDSGKNRGCWVMSLGTLNSASGAPSESEKPQGEGQTEPQAAEDVKILVRSDGTVTYVGKDIAYHLWKFARLGKDFGYTLFYTYPDSHPVWRTTTERVTSSESGVPDSPVSFGHASVAYSVIDTRQSYPQSVVAAALRALGFNKEAENLHHFAYEVVGLSLRTAEEMGLALSAEDRQKGSVDVSGRRGLGIKADDLIDTLVAKALEEVRAREMTQDASEQQSIARMIAVAALRYFLLKFSCRIIIVFDLKEALAFEGETGPYLQYTVVRARNILRKFEETNPGFASRLAAELGHSVSIAQLKSFFAGEDGAAFWELTQLAAQLEMVVDQAVTSTEPSVLAKYAFRLAQSFNNFYHRYHILNEPDVDRQRFLLYIVVLVNETLGRTLDLLGIDVPERM